MNTLKFFVVSTNKDIVKIENLIAKLAIEVDLDSLALLKLALARIPEAEKKLNSYVEEPPNIKGDEAIEEACTELDNLRDKIDLIKLKAKSLNLEVAFTPLPKSNSVIANSNANVPKLVIPPFKGDILQYEDFKRLFTATFLNNTNLSDPLKVSHLLTLLEGEPKELVKHTSLDSDGLKSALNTLDDKYSNSRKVTQTLIDRLFDVKPIQPRSLCNVEKLYTSIHEIIESLKNKDIDIDSLFLARYIIRLLDKKTREIFETEFNSEQVDEVPKTGKILTFLKSQIKFLQNLELENKQQEKQSISIRTLNSDNKKPKELKVYPKSNNVYVSRPSLNKYACHYCKKDHKIYECPSYLALSVADRKQFIMAAKCCTNCLNPKHFSKACFSKILCKFCQSKHHSTLCSTAEQSQAGAGTSGLSNYSKNQYHVHKLSTNPEHLNLSNEKSDANLSAPLIPLSSNPNNTTLAVSAPKPITDYRSQVLLSTVQLYISDSSGHLHKVRGLLDTCAEQSLISKALAEKLNLNIDRSKRLTVSGISNNKVEQYGTSRVRITSIHEGYDSFINVGVLDSITAPLPSMPVSRSFLKQFRGITLADGQFDKTGNIDVLLDAVVYATCLLNGRFNPSPDLPLLLYETKFGWVLSGSAPVACCVSIPRKSDSTVLLSTCCEIDSSIKKFWEWEAPPDKSNTIVDPTEKFFIDTYYRLPSGRFGVKLPFKESPDKLGNSYQRALKSLLALERKFATKPVLKTDYSIVMNKLISENVISKLPSDFIPPTNHYIMPHFPVTKTHGDSSKIRIVYNASAQTSSGISLNQILHTGPSLQTDNIKVLLLFRLHPVAFGCDIKAMFTQIEIDPQDRAFQLLLWRDEPNHPIGMYTYNRVVFGQSPSPYLAIRTLRQTATEGKETYPLASEAVFDSSFVDDILVSLPTLHQAVLCKEQLINLLKSGKFELGKWISNNNQLLDDLPSGSCLTSKSIHDPSVSSIAVLGLKWEPQQDVFYFCLSDYNHPTIVSKRNVLSMVARIYDPLGLLAPITSWIKIFLQLLWLRGLNWDDQLPEDLHSKWFTFWRDVEHISLITIPRPILIDTYLNFQIHGFADASEKCYAAVVYSRLELSSGEVITNLIIAKSKVSPLKVVSIPRLELNAALLLAKLINNVVLTLSPRATINSVYAWSDSSIVLSWIGTPPHSLKTYVANRIQGILDLTSPDIWRHVPTKSNPADIPSRGILPSSLPSLDLWWSGPSYLKQPYDQWPSCSEPRPVEVPELKPSLTLVTTTPPKKFFPFSSWLRAKRIVARIIRLSSNFKGKNVTGPIEPYELKEAELRLISLIQSDSFPETLLAVKKSEPLPPKFRKLSVFLDTDNILRAGGRLQHSNLPYTVKHPIVLPKDHPFVVLLVREAHQELLHAGPQAVFHHLLNKYWVLSGRSLIRKIVFQCMTCFRAKPVQAIPPLMGSVPSVRVTPSRPFTNVGLDYSGFFTLKLNKTRKSITTDKAYVCLFICLSSRAIHLEVVTDLTTPAFLAALTRFVSRRGYCQEIHCDNGTNFVGGCTELHRMIVKFLEQNKSDILDFTSAKGIKFNFLVPAAPFQGGIWEAGIKMAKYHLRRVMGLQLLTLEEFNTLVIQVEAVLNSRPISQSSPDPSDLVPLTPATFLIGSPLFSIPEPDLTNTKISPSRRWEFIQQLKQHFWQRWLKEYLPSLIPRNKWNRPSINLKPNQLVIVHEDHTPPLCWPMARILEVYPGQDGVVRTAKIRTAKGDLKRPVLKLYPLPLEESP